MEKQRCPSSVSNEKFVASSRASGDLFTSNTRLSLTVRICKGGLENCSRGVSLAEAAFVNCWPQDVATMRAASVMTLSR